MHAFPSSSQDSDFKAVGPKDRSMSGFWAMLSLRVQVPYRRLGCEKALMSPAAFAIRNKAAGACFSTVSYTYYY